MKILKPGTIEDAKPVRKHLRAFFGARGAPRTVGNHEEEIFRLIDSSIGRLIGGIRRLSDWDFKLIAYIA